MSEISRIYESDQLAERAVESLRLGGYTNVRLCPIGEPRPGSTVAAWRVVVRAAFGTGEAATVILDACSPIPVGESHHSSRDSTLDVISWLSGPVSPGAIASRSRRVSPGLISNLSTSVSSESIASLSGTVSSGSIAKWSRQISPGAIASLSRSVHSAAISRLSAGWLLSRSMGLPSLTSSQHAIEPERSLLIEETHG